MELIVGLLVGCLFSTQLKKLVKAVAWTLRHFKDIKEKEDDKE